MPFNSGDGKLPFARSTTARLPFGNDDNLPIPFNLSRSIIHLLPGGAFSGVGRTTQNVVQPGFEVALTQEALANGTFDITITVTGTNGATVAGFSYSTDFFVSSSNVTGTVGVKTVNLPGVYNFLVGATNANGDAILVDGNASIATTVTVTAVSNQYRIKTNETTPNYITSTGGVSSTVADGAVFEKLDPLFILSGAFFPNKSYRIKDTTNYLVSNTPAIESFTDTSAWKERATWQEQAYSGDIMLYDVTGAPSYLYVNSGALDTAESQTGQVPNPPPGEYLWDFEPFQETNRMVVQNIAQAANQTVSFDIVLTTALVQTDVLFKLKTGTYGVPKRFTQQDSTLPTASVVNGEYNYTFSFTDISGAYEVRAELSNGAVVVNSFNLPVYETQPSVPTISPPTNVSIDIPSSGTGVQIAITGPPNGVIDIWQGQTGDTIPDLYNPVGVQTGPSFVDSEEVIDSPEEVLITITEDKLYDNPYFIIVPRNARRAVATPLLEVAVPSSGYEYDFRVLTKSSNSSTIIAEITNVIDTSGTSRTLTASEISTPVNYSDNPGNGGVSDLLDTDKDHPSYLTWNNASHDTTTNHTLLRLSVAYQIRQLTITYARPVYMPKFSIREDGTELLQTANINSSQTPWIYDQIYVLAQVNASKPFRYLAFWGEGSVVTPQGPSFQEIELTLASSLNGLNEIKYGINDGGITFHDTTTWTYAASNMKDFSTIMNGQKSLTPNRHQYKDLPGSVVVWYMDLGSNVYASVSGGAYWTYDNDDWFPSGKLYGTNTDPSTFSDASLISNYDFICDLTRNGA